MIYKVEVRVIAYMPCSRYGNWKLRGDGKKIREFQAIGRKASFGFVGG